MSLLSAVSLNRWIRVQGTDWERQLSAKEKPIPQGNLIQGPKQHKALSSATSCTRLKVYYRSTRKTYRLQKCGCLRKVGYVFIWDYLNKAHFWELVKLLHLLLSDRSRPMHFNRLGKCMLYSIQSRSRPTYKCSGRLFIHKSMVLVWESTMDSRWSVTACHLHISMGRKTQRSRTQLILCAQQQIFSVV